MADTAYAVGVLNQLPGPTTGQRRFRGLALLVQHSQDTAPDAGDF